MFNDLAAAQDGGLDCALIHKGLLRYSDDVCEVVYRQMISESGHEPIHMTDNYVFNSIGIFTRPISSDQYRYCGYVSNKYKFIGNQVLNNRVRQSITDVGLPILIENSLLNYTFTKMRHEIIISNGKNIPICGDVLPVIIVSNTYDGTGAQTIAFGICLNENSDRYIFSFKMGEMRQIHLTNSPTSLNTVISTYAQVFTENITEVITGSFTRQIVPQELLSILDVVESIGKRRRERLTEILKNLNPAVEGQEALMPSAWQVFLALVRYTSMEPNLNVRRVLESVTERVLVIPKRMFDVLAKLKEDVDE